jgi:hypothetical protein
MATLSLHPSHSDASWFRSPSSARGDALAGDPAGTARSRALQRRSTAVKVGGWLAIAGMAAVTGWMVTSTAAADAIASWGTMGNVPHPRLTMTSLEGMACEWVASEAAPVVEEVAAPVQEVAGTPAEPVAAPVAVAAPAPAVRAPAVREASRQRVGSTEDPYGGGAPRRQAALDDPYQ